MRNLLYILTALFILNACSSGKKSLNKGNYPEAIEKAVSRLSNDPGNRKAQQVITEGYPIAMEYYQEQIDQILNSNERLKWSKTLQIMEQVNRLSDQIRRIPAARNLVPSPKTYTSELFDVKNRAAEERYAEGLLLLQRQNREDAKQAYLQFREADRLVPGYRDVLQKMNEAKNLATLTVIVETLPAPSLTYELTADFFYNQVMTQMNNRFPSDSFINFYSPAEAEQVGIKYPDMLVRLAFFDFYIGKPAHSEATHDLSREIEEKVEVKVSRDSVRYETRKTVKTGKIRIITDEVASGGLLDLKIEDFQTRKLLLDNKVPGEFMWRNQYGIFVGDEAILTAEEQKIIRNKAILPPGPQDMFLEFTRPIYSRLTESLTVFFRRYN
ncbi:hypothetical protein [Gaoshiqia sp. Z1-71]|uniref:hypothetical protein n=1 Tax=Gaoshiqia hydrogeniformans TaxID=3290090 RepID=UPI003BF886CA